MRDESEGGEGGAMGWRLKGIEGGVSGFYVIWRWSGFYVIWRWVLAGGTAHA